jgi:DNA-binding MarR family transcriptional regulator
MSLTSEERKTFLPILENIDRVIHSPARLMILTFLYVVEEGDMVYLLNQTGLTWGNLSANVHKLKDAGYVEVKKDFVDERPQTWVKLTDKGRQAFRDYREQMKGVLDGLPD